MNMYSNDPFDRFCVYLEKNLGMIIDRDKKYLVDSRVMPIVRREKLTGLDALLSVLESGRAPNLVQEVIQAMTINETYFFRDRAPFELIATRILPDICASVPQGQPVRILSAACSTGQEPYSLSILIEESPAVVSKRQIEIVAIDVSEAVLARARTGIFWSFEVERGLTPERRLRHFKEVAGGFEIKQELRKRITFKHANLMAPLTGLGAFDLILCRNVLIYFSPAQKTDILNRLGALLRPGGVVMLGASENTVGLDAKLVADSNYASCLRMPSASTSQGDLNVRSGLSKSTLISKGAGTVNVKLPARG